MKRILCLIIVVFVCFGGFADHWVKTGYGDFEYNSEEATVFAGLGGSDWAEGVTILFEGKIPYRDCESQYIELEDSTGIIKKLYNWNVIAANCLSINYIDAREIFKVGFLGHFKIRLVNNGSVIRELELPAII